MTTFTTKEDLEGIKKAFEAFMSKEDAFKNACISSTKAGWNGESFALLLNRNGEYILDWSPRFGNARYDSFLLEIPIAPLDSCDTNAEGTEIEEIWILDELETEFREYFKDAIEQIEQNLD